MFGARALPARWREQVELRDLIARVAGDLHGVAAGGGAPDAAAYPAVDGVVRFRLDQSAGGPE
jgi:hypothetical protein